MDNNAPPCPVCPAQHKGVSKERQKGGVRRGWAGEGGGGDGGGGGGGGGDRVHCKNKCR